MKNDGYTGRNFNRPGFQAMLAEAEAGKIGTIIVKDMSRFGRNYLEVGFYTEILFPKKQIRFIAINNSVDSDKPQDNDFTPFLNIMNEWYAKDTSNKIKAIFKSRMKDGMRCSGSIPYGYKRKPDDKQTLIVDEPAAEVVRKIFRLVCQGNSTTAIAEMLTADKVLIPSAYAALNQPKNCRHKNVADPYRWSATTVGYILDRQEYLGHTVLGKSICENFKTKQRRAATPDELMIFPDTHEAIIDQDTWDIARKIRSKKKPRVANGTYSHRLSGLVYCADCGSRMGFISPEANHSETHYDSDSAFQCGNYRSKSGECVSHYVKTSVLEAAILQAIQAVSKYVLENEDEFIQQLKVVWNEQQTRTANNGYQELAERIGVEELHALLAERDPESAAVIHPHNVRRVIRALEMHDDGISYAQQKSQFSVPREHYHALWFGLMRNREALYERINLRVDLMFELGLVDEVSGLMDQGLRDALTSMQAIGYKEIIDAFDGVISMDEASELIKMRSRRYAKRQLSWFKRDDRIVWFDMDEFTIDEVVDEILHRIEAA